MEWTDIAGILFVCVTANHLGLIEAIEDVLGKRIIILDCPKCATFWLTLFYGVGEVGFSFRTAIPLLTVSFLMSYSALWLELAEGYIDTLYLRLYEKIYNTTADETATDTNDSHTAGPMSDLQQDGF